MMKRLFLSSFLFFSVLQSYYDERVDYCYTFEYDDAGNPIKLHVQMHQMTVPIVDGMRMEFAKEQFVYKQTFAIDAHNKFSKSSISNSFHVIKNEIKKPQNYQPRFSGPDISKQRSGFYCSAKVVEHQYGVIESMSNEDLMKLFLYNRYCRIFYHMSSSEKIDMMQLRREKFVNKLLSDETLQDRVVLELWNEYKSTVWGDWSESEQKITEKLKSRQCKREKKMQEQFAKIIDQQKRSAQLELEKKRLKQIYNPELLNNYHVSSYSNDRALALKQTIDSGYKKDTKSYVFDAQTVGMLMACDIDIQQLNNVSGTLFQHQLYGEVSDCYKKIATFFCQPNFSHSVLAQHSLDFAQQVAKATELEAMELAIALSDVAHFCADTVHSIFTGVQESIHGIEQMVCDPADTIKNFGHSIGKVMNYVAEAMMYADCETIGWAYYSKILEQEHGYDVVYANAVVDQMQSWIVTSTGQEKIKIASRFLTDSIVYPRFFNLVGTVGKSCCAVIAEVTGLRFLESFADIYAEHKLATNLGDVGLNSMHDVGMSLMESEIEVIKSNQVINNTAKNALREFEGENLIQSTRNKPVFTRKGARGVAHNANGREGLVAKIESLLSGQREAVKVRRFPDDRIRYYKVEKLSKTPGPTRGSSYVTEYDPNRGIVRSWQESYDHLGKVNRVHPKTINGKDVIAYHYPHTGKEIEYLKKLKG